MSALLVSGVALAKQAGDPPAIQEEAQVKWYDNGEWPEGAEVPVKSIFKAKDGWFFVDETQTACLGPFDTESAAQEALHDYARSL